jgi:hypothetical protein
MNDNIIRYDCIAKTENGNELLYFVLDTYPSVRFRYSNIEFGIPDEANIVPIRFDLEIDDVQVSDDFNDQIKGLLIHLLQMANSEIEDIVASPNLRLDNGNLRLYNAVEQNRTRQEGTRRNKTRRKETGQVKLDNG